MFIFGNILYEILVELMNTKIEFIRTISRMNIVRTILFLYIVLLMPKVKTILKRK